MHSNEKLRRFEMAALRPHRCYRLPLVAPSEVLEPARRHIANSVLGHAPLFTTWLMPERLGYSPCA